MNANRDFLTRCLFLVVFTSIILPLSLGKKGGGGKPGGEPTPTTPPNPAFILSEQLNSGAERIVVTNEDGSNRSVLYASAQGRRVTDPEFVPGSDRALFLDWGSNGALPHTIKVLDFEVSETGVSTISVRDVLIENDGIPFEPSVSPDGQYVAYHMVGGSNSYDLFVKAIDSPDEYNRGAYIWGASEVTASDFVIVNTDWLPTPGLIAVRFALEDSVSGSEFFGVQIIDVSQTGTDALVGPAFPIPGLNRISAANTFDGIVTWLPIDTGVVVKRRGRLESVIKDVIHLWDIGQGTFGPLVDGLGNEIEGSRPIYGPSDARLLVEPGYGDDAEIVDLSDGSKTIVPELSARYGVGGWR